MNAQTDFPAAPWSTSLKVSTILGSIVICILTVAAYRAIPAPEGFTHNFGLGVACIPPACLLYSLLYSVNSYRFDGTTLFVERLFWSTRYSLIGLERAWHEPHICKGTKRIIGNGGLFAFTGLFYNPSLGRFSLLATNLQASVVLHWPERTIVITPANPTEFLHTLKLCSPTTVTH